MTGFLVTVAVGLLLAYANGANDNFKGVATLFGSGTTSYRRALTWATITTALGSVTALVLAQGLLAKFSGKGLLPEEVIADPRFPLSVALAAGATVLLATRFGLPISTTHALIGGLVGAGLAASPIGIELERLGRGFALPLMASPVLAVFGTLVLYPPLSFMRRRLGVTQETCICLEGGSGPMATTGTMARVLPASTAPAIRVGECGTERVRYGGRVLGIDARSTLDLAHYGSAGMVSFARGLNDTPKIAALLLVGNALAPNVAILAVGIVIAVGGVAQARRVAHTMSRRITAMNPGQGFVGNLVTGVVVVGASKLSLPVSTTHVSCGSIFGIGIASGAARWRTIGEILLAWITTLPLAAALAALAIRVL